MNDGVVKRAISSLGKGFDITSDFRLKYCKGHDRLVLLNETETRELVVPGFGSFDGVSTDIKCDKGDRTRYQSDILDFNQMSEFVNQKCSVPGKIPSGLFNAMFGFESGSWATDAANTKYLGLDGYFIVSFDVRIDRYPLVLSDEVRNAVPSAWDPSALARFIEKYGTHIIVGLGLGGQDVLLVPQAFNVFDPQPLIFNSLTSITDKDVARLNLLQGINVKCNRKGGDLSANSHCEWLLTVPSMPDAIHFSFIPITSVLNGVPGKGFLSHAINLYLRYKPPICDLQYFLDFQAHKMWAPVHNDLSLGPTTNRAIRTPALQFKLIGPKLYVNTTQVTVGKRPITGMRLYLEGMKCNRLAIHLQHLSNTPVLFQNKIEDALSWRGSEEFADERHFEAIEWKKFSHVCTAPVKYDPKWSSQKDVTFIVAGAQVHVKKHGSKSVLHLRLAFSKVPDTYILQSNWVQGASDYSQKSTNFFSAISTSITGVSEREKNPGVVMDSSVYPAGPPVPVQTQKLLKFVDMSQICRGPLDTPGHWIVTGAKLDLENGKICLRVKFSLLNIC
ncbi:hypothetical protein RJ640_023717 [Escallonia rubra]|uniref:MACPF domain-containing protein n=1 Tax=Escallonia rubra TaxID=112253 RepID=A0AA88R5G3_9ASTE|nr:hypothetical protein RJ640_023717 [Escallonia rubra]